MGKQANSTWMRRRIKGIDEEEEDEVIRQENRIKGKKRMRRWKEELVKY